MMPETVYFHNTLTKKVEKFSPLEPNKVQIYSCGPTVYDFAHIGNFRSFLMADILVRVLGLAGYAVEKVQNITDVGHLTQDDLADASGEDKIGKKAKLSGKSPEQIAEFYTEKFIEDESFLRILSPGKYVVSNSEISEEALDSHRPKATDFILEQIEMTKVLLEKKFAYEVNGSVYFRVQAFKNYGKLSGNSLENLVSGARVEVNTEKENPLDFALWKTGDEKHLMQWDFETGTKILPKDLVRSADKKWWGFPGWHIECSAMGRAVLGERFDIHTGGEDNVFPHHECEIAQNECSCSVNQNSEGNLIPYWLHAKHLLVDGKKMSKSKGNFFTIRDLVEKGWTGEEIRLSLLSGHYRSSLNFTEKSLIQARNSIKRILELLQKLKSKKFEAVGGADFVPSFRQKFKTALFDDLNVSEALASVFALVSAGFKLLEQQQMTQKISAEILAFLEQDFQNIFACIPQEKNKYSEEEQAVIEKLRAERIAARKEKNWEKADEIRDILKQKFEWEEQDGA